MRKHLPDFLPCSWTCQAYVWRRLLYFFRATNWIQAKSLRALGQSGNSNGRRLTWGLVCGQDGRGALRRDSEGLSDGPI